MKLTVEMLTETTGMDAAMNTGTLLSDSTLGHTGRKKPLTTVPGKLLGNFGKVVMGLVRMYTVNHPGSLESRDAMLKQKARVNHRYPPHLWKRHSALLVEAQRYNESCHAKH